MGEPDTSLSVLAGTFFRGKNLQVFKNEAVQRDKSHSMHADFSHYLCPCCKQGTPGCALIFTHQAPLFRGWILRCQRVCHQVLGGKVSVITGFGCHLSHLFFFGIYIQWNLQVTSLNLWVTLNERTAR